jgi:hypothetical protein
MAGNESYLALRASLRQMAEDAVPKDEDGRAAQIRARPEWRAATAIAEMVAQRDTLMGELAELRKKLGGKDAAEMETDALPEQ